MNGSSFRRVRRFSPARAGRALLYAAGVVSALLLPVLVLVVGLLVHLRIHPRDQAQNWVLGPLTSTWPWFGNEHACLLVLISIGLVVGLVEVISLMLVARQVQSAALQTVSELRSAIHSKAFQLGASDLLGGRRLRPEELFTEKAEVVRQGLVAWFQAVPRAIVALAALIVLALGTNWLLTLFTVLLGISMWLVYRWLRQRSRQVAGAAEDRATVLLDTMLEDLRLSPLSASYSLDRAQNESFEDGLKQYRRAALRARASLAYVGPLVLLVAIVAAALLTFVIGFAPRDELPFSSVVVVAAALACAASPVYRLYRLKKELPEAETVAAEILTYLERRPSVTEPGQPQTLGRLMQQVELDNVTLADREGRKLLNAVSLRIEAGSRVGVLASDPRTPLALGGLFVRLYDPAAGRVLFDGHDIRQVSLDSLRCRAAMVSPSGMLFTATVAENISCGDERFGSMQVQEAAKKARAYDFIQRLPHGFSSIIGEHGQRLDVGQAFRIALARALAREPSLLVIQEPDDVLDETAAAEIDEALRETADGRTLIFLPARIGTLRTLDRILLFHEGKLFAEGTHADLVRQCELYRHLHYVRFNAYRNTVKW